MWGELLWQPFFNNKFDSEGTKPNEECMSEVLKGEISRTNKRFHLHPVEKEGQTIRKDNFRAQ